MRKWRFRACVLLALLALSFAAWIWWLFCGGISHREVVGAMPADAEGNLAVRAVRLSSALVGAVRSEAGSVRERVDERADAIEARIAALEAKAAAADAKLDRIESKLDRILDLAAPRLPDEMRPATQQ